MGRHLEARGNPPTEPPRCVDMTVFVNLPVIPAPVHLAIASDSALVTLTMAPGPATASPIRVPSAKSHVRPRNHQFELRPRRHLLECPLGCLRRIPTAPTMAISAPKTSLPATVPTPAPAPADTQTRAWGLDYDPHRADRHVAEECSTELRFEEVTGYLRRTE